MGAGSSKEGAAGQPQGEVLGLTSEMQETIASDYEREQIVKLFGKQVEKMGERKAQRFANTVETKTQLQQQMESYRAQDQQRQSNLDQTIETMEDKFSDAFNIADYDIAQLEKKYSRIPNNTSVSNPCIDQQVALTSCLQVPGEGAVACDRFTAALDKCVSKTITVLS